MLSDAALVSPNVREIREMLPRYAHDNSFDSTNFTTRFPDPQITTYAEGLDLIATTSQDRTS